MQKLTEEGKPLAGARYEAKFCFYDIYSAPADRTWNCTTNDHWVSDDQGYLVLNDPSDANDGIPFEQYPLVYGCPYCGDASQITVLVGVKEIEAPAGYERDDTASTYYPGYLDDGSDKWGTATSNPGIETGAPTLVGQSQLGDAGTLRQVTGETFNGYEALYTNKFIRSGLNVRAVDQNGGQGVAGASYVVRLCDGDPENCRTLSQTFTTGQDGVLRDATGATLASVINPKMLENASVTLTQTSPADGYEASEPVVVTHTGGTTGWTVVGDSTPKSTIDLSMVKKTPPTTQPTTSEPTAPTTTEPTAPTSEPTAPTTTEPTAPTSEPTAPTTTEPTASTSESTAPSTSEPTAPSTSESTAPSTSESTTSTIAPSGTSSTGVDSSASSVHGVPSASASTPGEGPKVDTDHVGYDVRTSLEAVLAASVLGGVLIAAWRSMHRGASGRR